MENIVENAISLECLIIPDLMVPDIKLTKNITKYLNPLNSNGFSHMSQESDRRDLLAIKVKSEIFTEKERPSCCEQLQKV